MPSPKRKAWLATIGKALTGHHALVALLFLVLGWAAAFGTGRDLTTHSFGGNINADAGSYMWFLWHLEQAVTGQSELWRSELLFFPKGMYLIRQDWCPVVGVMALPFQPLGPVAAFNLQFLLAFVLCGVSTYWLALRLGVSRGFSLLAAVIFTFSEFHLLKAFHQGQPGHAHQEFVVLYLLCLVLFLRSGRWWQAVLAGALFFLAAFTNPYQMVFLLIFTLLLLGFHLGRAAWPLLRRRSPDTAGQPGQLGDAARRGLLFGLLSGGAALALVAPILALTWDAFSGGASSLGASGLRHPADLLSYVSSTLWSQARPQDLLDESLTAFPGYLVLASIPLSLYALRWRTGGAVWLAGALLFFLFSLGEAVTVGGEAVFSLPLFSLLQQLPIIRGVRLAARFTSMVPLCLGLAAALALTHLERRHLAGWPSWRVTLLKGVLVLAATAELLSGRARMLLENQHVREPVAVSGAHQIMALDQRPGTLVSYPMVWESRSVILGNSVFPPNRTLAMQMFHKKRLLTGLGDAIPPDDLQYFRNLPLISQLIQIEMGLSPLAPPQQERPAALATVRRLGIRYFLMHKGPDYGRQVPPGFPLRYWTARAIQYVKKTIDVEQVFEDQEMILLRVKP